MENKEKNAAINTISENILDEESYISLMQDMLKRTEKNIALEVPNKKLDERYLVYIKEKLRTCKEDFKSGKVITLEQVQKEWEAIEIEYIEECIEENQDDIKNGKCITLEELSKEMEELYESYYNTKSEKRA